MLIPTGVHVSRLWEGVGSERRDPPPTSSFFLGELPISMGLKISKQISLLYPQESFNLLFLCCI